jgi:hypothetical protein
MNAYAIRATTPMTTHYPKWSKLMLRDIDDTNHRLVDIQIYSGDYFVLLATQLDTLSQDLSAAKRDTLQAIVNNLLYLQSTYKITKKDT